MRPRLFATTGKPIIHSKSPQMFSAAFKSLGLEASYTRLMADTAEEALVTAVQIGIQGLNVTAPFKERMSELVEAKQADLGQLHAVNTIYLDSEYAVGFNTDVFGVGQALRSNQVDCNGRNVLVLGAGGAARAAVSALVNGGARVTVINRTLSNAELLARLFGISAVKLSEENLISFVPKNEIIISCLGIYERIVPPSLLSSKHIILDAGYAEESALVRDTLSAGGRVIDGREWLLYQGVAAFEHFSSERAPLGAMRNAIYGEAGHLSKNKLALIGFMGAGKSAVSEGLAQSLGLKMINLDQEIERYARKSIQKIFVEDGEEAFRKLEVELLQQYSKQEGVLLDCGGGIIESESSRKILREEFLTVWLWATASTIVERIGGGGGRPLVNVENKYEAVCEILQRRVPWYAEVAEVVISTEGKSPEDIAERIASEVCSSIKS